LGDKNIVPAPDKKQVIYLTVTIISACRVKRERTKLAVFISHFWEKVKGFVSRQGHNFECRKTSQVPQSLSLFVLGKPSKPETQPRNNQHHLDFIGI
jgi:hypothetical protein